MKKILNLSFILFFTLISFAQTDGISYQATIIGPDELELPGINSDGNILPNATIAIRFTIFDQNDVVEFQEIQTTVTDEFGRINLIIGSANHDEFTEISWDGTNKDLKVEIDFNGGTSFVDMTREHLTFLPYAYHRNITATGTLNVDENTNLNGELLVEGPTTLNSTLDVENNNATNLTGDLTVDGETNLNSNLNVNNKSITNLTGALNVGESTGVEDTDAPTVLNGTLNVVGKTTVTDFEATGQSTFNDLTANTLEVIESSTLNGDNYLYGYNTIGTAVDTTLVQGLFEIETDKQVKITSTLPGANPDGDQYNINNYPLLVEGVNQGIAIKVNAVGALNENNFISFWDETDVSTTIPHTVQAANNAVETIFDILGLNDTNFLQTLHLAASGGANTISGETLPDENGPMLWGRIEGETDESEFTNNADYNLDRLGSIYDVVDGALDLAWQLLDNISQGGDLAAALSSSTGCAGLGACVTAPIPSVIINETADTIIEGVKTTAAVANEIFASYILVTFDDNKKKYRGVSYASGAGDYAEYLKRADVNEKMTYGDIVGLNGGEISKNTSGSQKMMVISYKPAVLGALPQKNQEQFYEKVAFMGQVPVKVFGKVNVGDYILPSGENDGVGIALSPKEITIKDIKNIVGVAWEASERQYSYSLINVAVGINNNDNNAIVENLQKQVSDQKSEIKELKDLLLKTIERLDNIENGVVTQVASGSNIDEEVNIAHNGRHFEQEDDIVYFEITDEEIEEAFLIAEERMKESGFSKSENFIWNKLNEDPVFKMSFVQKLKGGLDKQVHHHKNANKKVGH